MTILVTGATGNVGRPLVERLLADGHRVRALTRDPAKANLPAGAEVVAGNLADTASLSAAFDGVSAAHLIGFGDDYAPLANGPEIMDVAKRAGTPEAGYTVLPTVEQVTGRPARTFAQWVEENAAAFRS
ncbi:NmrA family NAD(P)-binding protein [Actinomadura sp. NPDC047616]|uniref:SDR family oxidoreductase n=1 Tax=Actinomadura sp. NPDC047616 TaxID=3155914 RepID=UPI0033F2CE1C